MENQRLFLTIALVFVLFLLWQSWFEFQAAKYPPPATPAETAETATGGADIPQPSAAPRQDVPTVTGVQSAAEPALDSAQRVKVVTDLFEAEIDTTGGDLRHVGLLTYPRSVEQQDEPFVLLQDRGADLFIAQSGLLSSSGTAPNHYARYVPEQSEYRLADGQESVEVNLTWEDPESDLKVIKTYTFYRDRFVINVAHRVINQGSEAWSGSQYRQLQRTPPTQKQSAFGVYTYTGGVISTPEERYQKIGFDDMAESPLERQVTGGWVAMIQHYFLGAWAPDQNETNNFYTRVANGNRYILGMVGPQQVVPAGGEDSFSSQLYVGPKIQDRLEEVAPNLRLTVDYGFLTIIAQPLFWLLSAIHGVVGNWGWAIIFLTLLIKAVFFKLSETSYRSMANMRKLAPRMQTLKERYGHDRQKMNQAMMELYKTEKINPLGGCLPILVQIPVFIALYWMLLESVELRQAPFMLWIEDLSVKDPYYILPLIMGASMFIQQKLNPPPPDPIQAKVMMFLPLVFTVFFLWFPAGLVLYWVVNNVLSILQQYLIIKRVEAQSAKA
ncbi:MAG: membrane protein insertase YidC [Candidatus Competibacteraceae bacterium]|nr:membrane protein insertase YidC [Candidatus Competibacteraceae bacterium]